MKINPLLSDLIGYSRKCENFEPKQRFAYCAQIDSNLNRNFLLFFQDFFLKEKMRQISTCMVRTRAEERGRVVGTSGQI